MNFSLLGLSTTHPDIVSAIFGVLLCYVLTLLIAWTYVKTYMGLSYARSYVQAMILGAIVVCCAMQAIGDNLARGLGLMGALSIVRFRASLKDPRDMIFLFASLAVGIAAGVHAYNIAIVLTFGFCLAAAVLYVSPFNQNLIFDGMLRVSLPLHGDDSKALEEILKSYCQRFALVTLRELRQGGAVEYAYQIKLHKRYSAEQFMHQVQQMKGASGVSFLLQHATIEV